MQSKGPNLNHQYHGRRQQHNAMNSDGLAQNTISEQLLVMNWQRSRLEIIYQLMKIIPLGTTSEFRLLLGRRPGVYQKSILPLCKSQVTPEVSSDQGSERTQSHKNPFSPKSVKWMKSILIESPGPFCIPKASVWDLNC